MGDLSQLWTKDKAGVVIKMSDSLVEWCKDNKDSLEFVSKHGSGTAQKQAKAFLEWLREQKDNDN